jgi:hypothetical protein
MMAGEILRRGRVTPATTKISRKDQTLLDALEHGELFWFGDWPVVAVPRSGAIVYTVWNRSGQFIYSEWQVGAKPPQLVAPDRSAV